MAKNVEQKPNSRVTAHRSSKAALPASKLTDLDKRLQEIRQLDPEYPRQPRGREGAEGFLEIAVQDAARTTDFEAIIYWASRGKLLPSVADAVVQRWRKDVAELVNFFYELDEGKRLSGGSLDRRLPTAELLANYSSFRFYNFWVGYDTCYGASPLFSLLRSVEWCGIGGFDAWWNRWAREYQTNSFDDFDRHVEALEFFCLCRCDLAVQLTKDTLPLRLLRLSQLDLRCDVYPWRFFEGGMVEIVVLAGALLFAVGCIPNASIPTKLIDDASDWLLQTQRENGAWPWYALKPDGEGADDVVATCVAMHGLASAKPRGFRHALERAANWLWTMQDSSGAWPDEHCPAFVTVLALDSIALLEDRPATTCTTLAKSENDPESTTREKRGHDQIRLDGVHPPRTITYRGADYDCEMTKLEMDALAILLPNAETEFSALMNRQDGVWKEPYQPTVEKRNKVSRLLTRLNNALSETTPPLRLRFSVRKGTDFITREEFVAPDLTQ